jgi:hypothetical protein
MENNFLTKTEETKNFFKKHRLGISLFLAFCVFLFLTPFALAFFDGKAKEAKLASLKTLEIEAKNKWNDADASIQNFQKEIELLELSKKTANLEAENARLQISVISQSLGK